MTINILRKTYKSNNNSNTVKSVNNVRNIKNMNIRNKTHKRVYNKHKYVKKSLVGGSYNRITSTDTDIDSFHKKMFAYIDSGSITHVSLETFNTDITIQKATFTNNIILYAFLILYFIKEYTFKIDISNTSNIDILTKIIEEDKNILNNLATYILITREDVQTNNTNVEVEYIKQIFETNSSININETTLFTNANIFGFLQQYFTKSNIQDISAYLEINNSHNIINSITIRNTPKTQVQTTPSTLLKSQPISQRFTNQPPLTSPTSSTSLKSPPSSLQPSPPSSLRQSSLTTRRDAKIFGLSNLGASCYVSACLQLLWQISDIRDKLIDNNTDIKNNVLKAIGILFITIDKDETGTRTLDHMKKFFQSIDAIRPPIMDSINYKVNSDFADAVMKYIYTIILQEKILQNIIIIFECMCLTRENNNNINEDINYYINDNDELKLNINKYKYIIITIIRVRIEVTLNNVITINKTNYKLKGCVVDKGRHFNYYRYNNDGTHPEYLLDDADISKITHVQPTLQYILTQALIILYERMP